MLCCTFQSCVHKLKAATVKGRECFCRLAARVCSGGRESHRPLIHVFMPRPTEQFVQQEEPTFLSVINDCVSFH